MKASNNKSLKPYLSEPIPAIRLKYFSQPSREDRRKAMRESKMFCAECGDKIAVMGTYNQFTGEYTCDNCAIDNYQISEGFKTREAAEAHRRRLFDVSYLLQEMLIDDFLDSNERKGIEQLSDVEYQHIMDVSQNLWNMVPRAKKIQLENTADQSKIEKYFRNLIAAQF